MDDEQEGGQWMKSDWEREKIMKECKESENCSKGKRKC